jgi:aspartyl-tRNA synthetase
LPGEFYQLDLEMSFVTQEDVFAAVEPVVGGIFEQFGNGKKVTPAPWPRISYKVSMQKYGSDKPDLRIRNPHSGEPLEMADVSEHFRGSNFKVFSRILEDKKNAIWAIPAPGGGQRTFCDRMNSWAQGEGQPGLGYIFWREGAGAGPIANNIGPERTELIRLQLGLQEGDAAFFAAGDPEKFAKFAGAARIKVGADLNLVDENSFELAWIVDFPMFEWNEEEKKVDFSHKPFSMPQGGLEALNTQDPVTIKAFQYDIACNGFEIASGGIRNHMPDAMVKAFEIAGYGEETVIERFGGMYRAFQYGAPPHGGMAAGVDRMVMLLCGAQNLREVALFPMNQQALDLLMGAPSDVGTKQLRELNLRLNIQEK